jgi:hypothetical protein
MIEPLYMNYLKDKISNVRTLGSEKLQVTVVVTLRRFCLATSPIWLSPGFYPKFRRH